MATPSAAAGVSLAVPDGKGAGGDSPAMKKRLRDETWTVLQSGVLFKKGKGLLNKWQSRFWVLYSSGDLVYYTDQFTMSADGKCATVVQLQDGTVSVLHGRGQCKDCHFPGMVPDVCCLGLVTASRTYYVYASSQEEVKQWKKSIEEFSPSSTPSTPSKPADKGATAGPSPLSLSPSPNNDESGGKGGSVNRIRSINRGRRSSFFWRDKTPKVTLKPVAAEAPAALTVPVVEQASSTAATPESETEPAVSHSESFPTTAVASALPKSASAPTAQDFPTIASQPAATDRDVQQQQSQAAHDPMPQMEPATTAEANVVAGTETSVQTVSLQTVQAESSETRRQTVQIAPAPQPVANLITGDHHVAPADPVPLLPAPPGAQGHSRRHRPSMTQMEMIRIPEKDVNNPPEHGLFNLPEPAAEKTTPSVAVSQSHDQLISQTSKQSGIAVVTAQLDDRTADVAAVSQSGESDPSAVVLAVTPPGSDGVVLPGSTSSTQGGLAGVAPNATLQDHIASPAPELSTTGEIAKVDSSELRNRSSHDEENAVSEDTPSVVSGSALVTEVVKQLDVSADDPTPASSAPAGAAKPGSAETTGGLGQQTGDIGSASAVVGLSGHPHLSEKLNEQAQPLAAPSSVSQESKATTSPVVYPGSNVASISPAAAEHSSELRKTSQLVAEAPELNSVPAELEAFGNSITSPEPPASSETGISPSQQTSQEECTVPKPAQPTSRKPEDKPDEQPVAPASYSKAIHVPSVHIVQEDSTSSTVPNDLPDEQHDTVPSFLDMASDEVPATDMEFKSKLERERWEQQQVEERQAKFRRMSAAQLRGHEAARLAVESKRRKEKERQEQERLRAEEEARQRIEQEELRAIAARKENVEESVRARMMKLEEDRKRLAEEGEQRLRKVSGTERRLSVRKRSTASITLVEPTQPSPETHVASGMSRKESTTSTSSTILQERIDAERQAAEEMEQKLSQRRATISKERDEQRQAARRKKEAALAEKRQQELREQQERDRLEEEKRKEAIEHKAMLAKQQREAEEQLATERQERLEAERLQAEEHEHSIRKVRANMFLEQDKARRQREAAEQQKELEEEQRKLKEADLARKRLEEEKAEELARLNARPKTSVDHARVAIEERHKQLEQERLQLAEAERQRAEKAMRLKEQHEKEAEQRRRAEQQKELEEEQRKLKEAELARKRLEEEKAEELARLNARPKTSVDHARVAIEERHKQLEQERLQCAEAERQREEKARQLNEQHGKEAEQRRLEKLELEQAEALERQRREAQERAEAEERWRQDAERARQAQRGVLASKDKTMQERQQHIEEERRRVEEFDNLISQQRFKENKEELKRLERDRAKHFESIRAREERERQLAEQQRANELFRAEEARKASEKEKERVLLQEEQLRSAEDKLAAERNKTEGFEKQMTDIRNALGPHSSEADRQRDEEDLDVLARRDWENRNSPMMVMRRHSLRPSDIEPRKIRKHSLQDEGSIDKFLESPKHSTTVRSLTPPSAVEPVRQEQPQPQSENQSRMSDAVPTGIKSDQPLRLAAEDVEGADSSPSVQAARMMWQTRTEQSPQPFPKVRKASDSVVPRLSVSIPRSSSPVSSPLLDHHSFEPLASPKISAPMIPSPLTRSRAPSSSSVGPGLSGKTSSSAVDIDAEVEKINRLSTSSPSAPSSSVVSPTTPASDNVFSGGEGQALAPTNRIIAIKHFNRERRNSLPNSDVPKVVLSPRPSTPVLARVSHLASDSDGESSGGEEEPAVRRQRQATKWVEKELNKLIQTIKDSSQTDLEGKPSITFKDLFEVASDVFEALSGTLLTARKHKIVTYEGDLLLQGVHNNVVIVLLEQSVPDGAASSFIKQRKSSLTPDSPRRGRAFSAGSLQSSQSKCYRCGKTVYPVEFVGADDRAFHKACFRCQHCQVKLAPGNYSTLDGKYYCKTHYERLYREKGDYSLM